MRSLGRIVALIIICALMLIGIKTDIEPYNVEEETISENDQLYDGGDEYIGRGRAGSAVVVDDARTGVMTTDESQKPTFQMGRTKYMPPSSDKQILTIMRYSRPQERGRLISLLLKHGYRGSLDRLSSMTDSAIYKMLPALRSHDAVSGRASHQGDEVVYRLREHIESPDKLAGGKLMDVGCGDGTITRVVAEQLGIKDISCIEVNEFVPNGIKYYAPGQYNGEQVDLVTAFFSLHHIPDVVDTIERIYNMLKPGGYVMIKEHDCWNPIDAMIVDIEHSVFIARETNFKPLADDHTVWFKNCAAWNLMFSKFTFIWSDYYEASGRADITPSRGYFAIYRKET